VEGKKTDRRVAERGYRSLCSIQPSNRKREREKGEEKRSGKERSKNQY